MSGYKTWVMAALLILLACTDDTPVKIGFIGGTSGRVADLGVAGRNGVILAVDQANKSGGIQGRPIELILKDDQQDETVARSAMQDLLLAQVAAVIGPMTSAMAMAVMPQAEEGRTLVMGATVTTNLLSGKDDLFFRTLSATRDHAVETARYLHHQMSVSKVAFIYDMKNQAYTESWANDFEEGLKSLGGSIVARQTFTSSDEVLFGELAMQSLAQQPDAVVLVVNSVDGALLAKQLRQRQPELVIATSEWAGTERFIELGGRYVEGVVVPQYLDRHSRESEYQRFYQAYKQRFDQEPGFPGLVSYNAAQVVIRGLREQQSGEHLKDTLLRLKHFEGIQNPITLDAFGDSVSKTYLTRITDGQFVVRPR